MIYIVDMLLKMINIVDMLLGKLLG